MYIHNPVAWLWRQVSKHVFERHQHLGSRQEGWLLWPQLFLLTPLLGLNMDNGKENGQYYSTLELCMDNGKRSLSPSNCVHNLATVPRQAPSLASRARVSGLLSFLHSRERGILRFRFGRYMISVRIVRKCVSRVISAGHCRNQSPCSLHWPEVWSTVVTMPAVDSSF